MEERLIEKVSVHEALYNSDSPSYRDQRARNAAWRQVGQELSMPASKCRETWAKLRNCYTNALKRRTLGKNGQVPKKYPKWKYEDQMSFLAPYAIIRSNHDTNSLDLSDMSYDLQESYIDENTQEEYRTSNNSFDIYPCASGFVSAASKRRKTTEMSAEDVLQMLEANVTQQKEHTVKKDIDFPALDSTDMFYLSMARTAKRLPLVEQAKIRVELCRLISETEIRYLDRSVQSVGHTFSLIQNSSSESVQHSVQSEEQSHKKINVK